MSIQVTQPPLPVGNRRHDTLWSGPMDLASPLDASSNGAAWVLAATAGKDCMQVTAGGTPTWAVIKPSLLTSFNPILDTFVKVTFWVKSTLVSGTPQVTLTWTDSISQTATFALPTGSYDWQEVSYRQIVYGSNIPGISSVGLKFGMASGSGVLSIAAPRIALLEQPIARISGSDPGHVTKYRGFNFHPLCPRNQIASAKANYNSNLIRFQLSPSAYDDSSIMYTGLPDPTNVTLWRNWFAHRTSVDLANNINWAEQNNHKLVVGMMTMLGGVMGAQPPLLTPLQTSEYLRAIRTVTTQCMGRKGVYAIELFNEPSIVGGGANLGGQGPLDSNYWNIQIEAIKEVRRIDPTRKVLVAYAGTGDISWMRFIEAVSGYGNVDYVVHCYTPFTYTDQGSPATGVTYPGSFDKSYLYHMLAPARALQLQTGARIFVTEFSPWRWNPGADLYARDVMDIYEEYGWDYAYFSYLNPPNAPGSVQETFSLEHDPLPAYGTGVLSSSPSALKLQVLAHMAANVSPYTSAEDAPQAPTGLTLIQPWTDAVSLSWTAPNCTATTFTPQYKRDADSTWISLTPQTPDDTNNVLLTGTLTPGTSWDFRVILTNSYGTATSSVATFTPTIIDAFAGVTTAINEVYSLSRTVPGYSGVCIKVRRSSDNTTSDIGFDMWGNLDQTALLSWVGSGDGFIVTWYGQKSVANRTQSNIAKQPRIVLGGVVDAASNGIPAIYFRGTDYLDETTLFVVNQAEGNAILGVIQAAATSPVGAYLWSEGNSSSQNCNYSLRAHSSDAQTGGVQIRNDANVLQVGNGLAGVAGHKLFDGTLHRFERYDDLTNVGIWIDNYQWAIQTYTRVPPYTPNVSRMGGFANGTSGSWIGWVQEIISMGAAITAGDRTIFANSQKHRFAEAA